MRIKRTNQLVTIGVITLCAVTVVCALVSRQFRSMQERAYETRLSALREADRLAEGSDRLTAAVRAYAATGDRRYLNDFDLELKVDRTRDKAIERLNQLGLNPSELSLLSEAKRNSDNLVQLENRAFGAAERKDFAAAVALVYGEEYRKAKESIMQPIADCRKSIESRLARDAGILAARAKVLTNIALGLLVSSGVAMISALFFFYRKRVVIPLSVLNQSLRDLLARKQGVSIAYQNDRSEIGEIAQSLESYRRAADQGEAQRWAKTVMAEIASLLQTADTTDEFAERLTSKLIPALRGGCGALFIFDEATQRFEFAGGYCYQKRPDLSTSYPLGKSLVGQCGKEKRTITLVDIPPDYIKIVSGTGGAPPRAITLVPMMSRDSVLAVLEIGSFLPLTELQNTLLHEAAASAALALEVLLRNTKTRELLDKVRAAESQLRPRHHGAASVDVIS